jgi:hypothetical protein
MREDASVEAMKALATKACGQIRSANSLYSINLASGYLSFHALNAFMVLTTIMVR